MGRRTCRFTRLSGEHSLMLHIPADLRAARVTWAVCKGRRHYYGSMRQAASTLGASLAPRHPRQACRLTPDSLHASLPRPFSLSLDSSPTRRSSHRPPAAAVIAHLPQQLRRERAQQADQLIGGNASGPSLGQPGLCWAHHGRGLARGARFSPAFTSRHDFCQPSLRFFRQPSLRTK